MVRGDAVREKSSISHALVAFTFLSSNIFLVTAFQKGLKLPGSKSDVIRTKSLSGPSPVGGSMGGFDSKNISTLDEFELQAANYNMACAHAQLGQIDEAVTALRASFENGFDNFATVRADPDLGQIQSSEAFKSLMDEFEPKNKGFNPFGFFGRK